MVQTNATPYGCLFRSETMPYELYVSLCEGRKNGSLLFATENIFSFLRHSLHAAALKNAPPLASSRPRRMARLGMVNGQRARFCVCMIM